MSFLNLGFPSSYIFLPYCDSEPSLSLVHGSIGEGTPTEKGRVQNRTQRSYMSITSQ